MPDTGGPNTVGEDNSKGEIRCDAEQTVILTNIDKVADVQKINKAIEEHHKQTGHTEYSFYGRTQMET